MRILVCGGAGYIGSQMCKVLAEHGHQVGVVDDLSTGHFEAVRWGTMFHGSIGDREVLNHVFATFRPEGVLHFAAKSLVSESMTLPAVYYINNVAASLTLFDVVKEHSGIPLVFSSTAAVYGLPKAHALREDHPLAPINVYGRSKMIVEMVLKDYFNAYGMSSVCFRYFNAAGADVSCALGEDHHPETHLIPRVLCSALGKGNRISVFGTDYATQDGTCVRDYVHVQDLCEAHLLGLEHAARKPGAHVFNLGNERGYSVLEILASARTVTGMAIPYDVGPRRAGDPDRLVADAAAAREVLGWAPKLASLDTIIETAWRWHRHRHGRSFSVASNVERANDDSRDLRPAA